MFTEPLEPFLYTKRWLSRNPLPPRTLKSRISGATSSKQQKFDHSVKNDNHLDISQSRSFKEQISGNFRFLHFCWKFLINFIKSVFVIVVFFLYAAVHHWKFFVRKKNLCIYIHATNFFNKYVLNNPIKFCKNKRFHFKVNLKVWF